MKKVVLPYSRKHRLIKIVGFTVISFPAFMAFSVYTTQRFIRIQTDHLAVRNLYDIHSAQGQFKSSKGRHGTLKELAEAGLIEPHFAGDQKPLKYSYWISDLSSESFCVHADRKSWIAGYHDFNMSEDGILHFQKSETIGSIPRGQGDTTGY